MRVDEFDYKLPPELIAQTPLQQRSESRLLVANPVEQSIIHSSFKSLTEFLQPGDVLVFNNSKVLPARLYGMKRGTGAKIEILLLKPMAGAQWSVLARPAKRVHAGDELEFHHEGVLLATALVKEVLDEGLRVVEFHLSKTSTAKSAFNQMSFEQFLDQAGSMPLPPYIQQPLLDKQRYQTVYAKVPGSVAAPTAGLHFTEQLLHQLVQMGVHVEYLTLHVGLGTFRPVQVSRVEEHAMHSETYEVPQSVAATVNRARDEGRRVIAVGTTALRTLESAGNTGRLQAGRDDTSIFIYPGYQFQMVDALITNFHLPKSTLIMLVATMMGLEFTKTVYEEAVRDRYRFFSFGDAMFITRRTLYS